MQKRPILRGQAMAEKKMEEEIPVPDHFTPEQQDAYCRLWRASRMKESGFQTAAVEVLSTNPELAQLYIKRHREETVEKVAALLSETGPLLDMSAETIRAIIDLPTDSLTYLVKATHVLQKVGIQLDIADVKTAMDLAKVMKVMEAEVGEDEDQEEKMDPAAEETYLDGDNSTVPNHIIARKARARLSSPS